MRSATLSVLAVIFSTQTLAFGGYDNYKGIISARDADDALSELFIREALADPSFRSFISGVGNGFRKGANFLSNHRGQIMEGAETAAKFAPLLIARNAEAEADPNPRIFFSEAKSGVQNAGRYISYHRGQILNGIGAGAKFVGSMAGTIGGAGVGGTAGPPADAETEGVYRCDLNDELYAREYDDELFIRDSAAELYARDFEPEYVW